jgi:EAL domain-containing protein (putative c-di-GMP-specific phosphodiesterase class I)
MDDFGMGYSSLLYMRRFPVHAIKIDGSLTRDVLSNSTNADIIRTIVSLGRAQEVVVVVEFVETLEQRDALAGMGCDLFQGHFFSPALIESACVPYFRQHR